MNDPTVPSLVAGFLAAWLLIAAYVLRLQLAQRRASRRIREARPASTS